MKIKTQTHSRIHPPNHLLTTGKYKLLKLTKSIAGFINKYKSVNWTQICKVNLKPLKPPIIIFRRKMSVYVNSLETNRFTYRQLTQPDLKKTNDKRRKLHVGYAHTCKHRFTCLGCDASKCGQTFFGLNIQPLRIIILLLVTVLIGYLSIRSLMECFKQEKNLELDSNQQLFFY